MFRLSLRSTFLRKQAASTSEQTEKKHFDPCWIKFPQGRKKGRTRVVRRLRFTRFCII